jgi:DNA excision repair protein ERCC-5
MGAGIGIVNAVEIVHAFPGSEGLRAFSAWVHSPDQALLDLAAKGKRRRRASGSSKTSVGGKGGGKGEGEDGVVVLLEGDVEGEEEEEEEEEEESEVTKEFKRKHRNIRKSWDVGQGFPNAAVIEAYMEPRVETAREK